MSCTMTWTGRLLLCAATLSPALPVHAQTPVTSFVTTIGPLDHYNGRGVELSSAAAVIRQDRFRVHSGRLDAGDQVDPVYGAEKQRAQLEQLIARSPISADVARTLVERNPRIRVDVYSDRVSVTVLDPGTQDVACVITPEKIANIPWSYEGSGAKLPSRMTARGWKLERVRGGEGWQLKTPTGELAARFHNGAEVVGPTCVTTHGVHIGSTYADARKDTDFAANACTCDSGGSVLVSKDVNKAVMYVRGQCRKPITCPGDGELPPCAGDWGRSDCTINSISVGMAPGI